MDFYNTAVTKNHDLDAHNLYNTVTDRAQRKTSVEVLEKIEETSSLIKEKAVVVSTKSKSNKIKRI